MMFTLPWSAPAAGGLWPSFRQWLDARPRERHLDADWLRGAPTLRGPAGEHHRHQSRIGAASVLLARTVILHQL